VFRQVIHLEQRAEQDISLRGIYESWRQALLDVPPVYCHAAISLRDYEGTVTTWADSVDVCDDFMLFFHRSRDPDLLINQLITQQGLVPSQRRFPMPSAA